MNLREWLFFECSKFRVSPDEWFGVVTRCISVVSDWGTGWPASCITQVCLRMAFNIMNKNHFLGAEAAITNVEQECWRTSRAIRRIRVRMHTLN
jgi:hypothetical protein